MNLKEAFRFQNKLNTLIEQTQDFLTNDSNVVNVETTYLRKRVYAEAEDEVVAKEKASEYCDKVNEVMAFCLFLLKQKEALSKAICAAKAALPIDMDSEITLNTYRQQMSKVFAHMANLRSSESVIPSGGTGYRFNAEGNQVTYRCDVRKVTTINFDRNKAKKNVAELNRQADEMSVQLDKSLINSVVEYEAPFDVNASFDDAFEAFSEISQSN